MYGYNSHNLIFNTSKAVAYCMDICFIYSIECRLIKIIAYVSSCKSQRLLRISIVSQRNTCKVCSFEPRHRCFHKNARLRFILQITGTCGTSEQQSHDGVRHPECFIAKFLTNFLKFR